MKNNNNRKNGKKVGHSDPQPEHGNDNNKHKDTRPGKSHSLMVVVY